MVRNIKMTKHAKSRFSKTLRKEITTPSGVKTSCTRIPKAASSSPPTVSKKAISACGHQLSSSKVIMNMVPREIPAGQTGSYIGAQTTKTKSQSSLSSTTTPTPSWNSAITGLYLRNSFWKLIKLRSRKVLTTWKNRKSCHRWWRAKEESRRTSTTVVRALHVIYFEKI